MNHWSSLLLSLFALNFSNTALAQYVPEDKPKKDTTIYIENQQNPSKSKNEELSDGGFKSSKLVPGGNFALNFGNPSFVDLSPSLGYMVTDDLLLGLGATYMNFRSNGYGFSFYGGRILGRYRIAENIYGNAELDFLNVPDDLQGYGVAGMRRWLVSPLIGASYVVPFGRRGGVQATLFYNLNYQQKYSPYASPVVWRIGFFL